MTNFSPELRWFIVANLLGLAAVVSYFCMRRIVFLVPALLLSPLPAFLFVRLTSVAYPGAPQEQVDLGIFLSALSCYLPPALGVLAAYLVTSDQRPQDIPNARGKRGRKMSRPIAR